MQEKLIGFQTALPTLFMPPRWACFVVVPPLSQWYQGMLLLSSLGTIDYHSRNSVAMLWLSLLYTICDSPA